MNSKEAFRRSLEKLLRKKKLDDIHVSEIVAGSSFSRKTFYRYFHDKYDLANWYFAQFFESSFGRIIGGVDWEDALLRYLDIYEEKSSILKNAYSSHDINSLHSYDIAVTRKTYEKYLLLKGADIDSPNMQFAIEIASRGGTEMIIEWLFKGMNMDKKQLISLIKQTLPNDILNYIS